jgi:hypothetical protein
MAFNTPIVLIIFNRPHLTEIVLKRIAEIKPKILLVVADGPRNSAEKELCKKTRGIINRINWDCEVIKNYSAINLGCGKRISSGLDWVFGKYDKAIILEDDCIPTLSFFSFCEKLLNKYKSENRVMHISGTNFCNVSTSYSYYFLRYPHVWGWATWKRAWKKYDFNMNKWYELQKLGKLNNIFESPAEQKTLEKPISLVLSKEFDTWDIQWLFACLYNKGLSIVPALNLVSNQGFSEDSTHNIPRLKTLAKLTNSVKNIRTIKHPPRIKRIYEADKQHLETVYGNFTEKGVFPQEKATNMHDNNKMNKLFYRFDFDEPNLNKQKDHFIKFIASAKLSGITLKYAKQFPPCILNETHAYLNQNLPVILDNKTIIVTNNLYYGHEFKPVNGLFAGSPFISAHCKNCTQFNNRDCRGLHNGHFLKDKQSLIHILGHDNYIAIRSDYENGMLVAGSMCASMCKFCLDRTYPSSILRRIPSLNANQILHFLHYLPYKLHYLGTSYHCQSGELSDSVFFNDILQKIKYFMALPTWLTTIGRNLDTKMIKLLKELHLSVALSVNSLNPMLRQKFINETKLVDYMKIIKALKESSIDYEISIVPLYSFIEAGDIFKTINTLIRNDPNCMIRINPPSVSKYTHPDMAHELQDGYAIFKRKLSSHPHRNVWFPDEMDRQNKEFVPFKDKAADVSNKLLQYCQNGKTYALLCPGTTIKQLQGISSDSIQIYGVPSSLGFRKPCSGILLIKDYINTMHFLKKRFDYIMLPRNSFDINFDDFSLHNINELRVGLINKGTGIILN